MTTEIIEHLLNLNEIARPRNKAEIKRFGFFLSNASTENPLQIFVGSCPDYSHEDGKYTHKSLGEGVPLLTTAHLKANLPLLHVLEEFLIPYRYTIMIADVEADDKYFQAKFAQGEESKLLAKCQKSQEATLVEIEKLRKVENLQGQFLSSSFYQEFGKERFLACQTAYQEVLRQRYLQDSSFRCRVADDISARIGLYTTMYPEIVGRCGFSNQEQEDFLVGRTIRTMAQYLTLGRLIAEDADYPVIINHPTRNIGMFNSRNKYLLPSDGPQPHPTIPVFEIRQEVY